MRPPRRLAPRRGAIYGDDSYASRPEAAQRREHLMLDLLRPLRSAAALALAAGVAWAGGVQVGDTLKFSFRRPVFEGPGVKSSEDLRGRPVLYEFWGTRCGACVGGAVPSILKLQETYGDDLQVVLVEVQNEGPERSIGYALRRGWLGGRAMWTSEYPFEAGVSTLPYAVLAGSDGRVLAKGNPIQFHKEFERLILDDQKQRSSAPRGVPEAVRPAWIEFGKGRLGRGISLAREAGASDDPEVATAAHDALLAFRARAANALARAERMVERGSLADAQALVESVRRACDGETELETRCSEFLARLAGPTLAAEREAEKVFLRLEDRLFQSSGDATSIEELASFAQRQRTLRVGKRAADLLEIARASGERR